MTEQLKAFLEIATQIINANHDRNVLFFTLISTVIGTLFTLIFFLFKKFSSIDTKVSAIEVSMEGIKENQTEIKELSNKLDFLILKKNNEEEKK